MSNLTGAMQAGTWLHHWLHTQPLAVPPQGPDLSLWDTRLGAVEPKAALTEAQVHSPHKAGPLEPSRTFWSPLELGTLGLDQEE